MKYVRIPSCCLCVDSNCSSFIDYSTLFSYIYCMFIDCKLWIQGWVCDIQISLHFEQFFVCRFELQLIHRLFNIILIYLLHIHGLQTLNSRPSLWYSDISVHRAVVCVKLELQLFHRLFNVILVQLLHIHRLQTLNSRLSLWYSDIFLWNSNCSCFIDYATLLSYIYRIFRDANFMFQAELVSLNLW